MGYTPNNPYIPGDPYSYDLRWFVENLNKIKANIIQLEKTYTTPTVVDLASEMVDVNKIYVYTGNEVGYQPNHWYYYDLDTHLWTDGGAYGSITPDAALDASSTNAVENRVITNALATKFDTADIDNQLDLSSPHPLENGVITANLALKLDIADIDDSLDAVSTNPVENAVITAALAGKQSTLTLPLAVAEGGSGQTGTSAPNTSTCSRTTGSNITYQEYKEWGKLATQYLILTTDVAYSPGQVLFTGITTKPSALISLGSGYYGDCEMELQIDFNGVITVTVFADTIPASTAFGISITYLLP